MCTRYFHLLFFDPKSALISSLSLCLLLRTNDCTVAALAAGIAISSKFAIRWKDKHIFNPTNLALVVIDIEEESDDKNVPCVPNALVLCSPVIDTSADGYGHELLGKRWQELSPLHHVRPDLPPTIILHGMRDTTTPFAGAKAFDQAMRAAGNKIEFVAHASGSHSYMMRTKELFDEAMGRIV